MIFNYKIDDIPLGEIGAIPARNRHIALDGIFDLPKRIGDTSYNWGDSIEPFVDHEDIQLDGRTLSLMAIVKNENVDFFKQVCIEAKELSFDLDTYDVVCKDAIAVDQINDYSIVTARFWQNTVEIENLIMYPSNTGPFKIDNYGMKSNFDVYLQWAKGLDDAGKRIEVATTEFYEKTYFRNERNVTLRCAMKGGTIGNLYSKMRQLQSLVMTPGMKRLFVKNKYLDVYFKSGIKAQLVNDKILTFELIATVND